MHIPLDRTKAQTPGSPFLAQASGFVWRVGARYVLQPFPCRALLSPWPTTNVFPVKYADSLDLRSGVDHGVAAV
jgi:hypothetical protein